MSSNAHRESKAVITFREEVIDSRYMKFRKLDKNMEIKKNSRGRPANSTRFQYGEGMFRSVRISPLTQSGIASSNSGQQNKGNKANALQKMFAQNDTNIFGHTKEEMMAKRQAQIEA